MFLFVGIVVLVMILAYIILRLMGFPMATYLASMTGIVGIISIIVVYAGQKDARHIVSVKSSTEKIRWILHEFRTDPNLSCLWDRLNNDGCNEPLNLDEELFILEILKTAEIVNSCHEMDRRFTDETDTWMRMLRRWLADNVIQSVWKNHSYLFSARANRLFSMLTL